MQMLTGSASIIASSTILYMIHKSSIRLSTIYRRLFHAICVFDIIQSISQASSTLPMPAGSIYGAIGNDATCAAQGFMVVVGASGAILYSFSMTLYFLAVIKFKCTERCVKKYIEPFLHAFPILFSFAMAFTSLATNSLNPGGTVCLIAAKPEACQNEPDIECESMGNPAVLKIVAVGAPVIFVFIANIFTLLFIWWSVYSASRNSRMYLLKLSKRMSVRASVDSVESGINTSVRQNNHPLNDFEQRVETKTTTIENSIVKKKRVNLHILNSLFCPWRNQWFNYIKMEIRRRSTPPTTQSALADRLSRPSRSTMALMRTLFHRALAFSIGFCLTYGASLVHRFWEMKNGSVPFALELISRSLFSLQGVFNVCIYTLPFVITFRSEHGCSWFHAFCEVLKSGGDTDNNINRLSLRSMRSSSTRRSIAIPVL